LVCTLSGIDPNITYPPLSALFLPLTGGLLPLATKTPWVTFPPSSAARSLISPFLSPPSQLPAPPPPLPTTLPPVFFFFSNPYCLILFYGVGGAVVSGTPSLGLVHVAPLSGGLGGTRGSSSRFVFLYFAFSYRSFSHFFFHSAPFTFMPNLFCRCKLFVALVLW